MSCTAGCRVRHAAPKMDLTVLHCVPKLPLPRMGRNRHPTTSFSTPRGYAGSQTLCLSKENVKENLWVLLWLDSTVKSAWVPPMCPLGHLGQKTGAHLWKENQRTQPRTPFRKHPHGQNTSIKWEAQIQVSLQHGVHIHRFSLKEHALFIWPKVFLGDKPFTTLPRAWPQQGCGNGGTMGPGRNMQLGRERSDFPGCRCPKAV